MWTAALLSSSVTGVWLSARHWYGWCVTVGSEFLWGAYSIHTHDHPLLYMSFVWAGVNARNARVTWRDQHRVVADQMFWDERLARRAKMRLQKMWATTRRIFAFLP